MISDSSEFDFVRAANLLRECRRRKIAREGASRWTARNPQYQNRWAKARRKTNPNFRIKCNFHRDILALLLGNWASKNLLAVLGTDQVGFRRHLESLFTGGMDWSNRGRAGWSIDCIIPCERFDLTDPVQLSQCFHFSNLQPLWRKANLQKSRPIR